MGIMSNDEFMRQARDVHSWTGKKEIEKLRKESKSPDEIVNKVIEKFKNNNVTSGIGCLKQITHEERKEFYRKMKADQATVQWLSKLEKIPDTKHARLKLIRNFKEVATDISEIAKKVKLEEELSAREQEVSYGKELVTKLDPAIEAGKELNLAIDAMSKAKLVGDIHTISTNVKTAFESSKESLESCKRDLLKKYKDDTKPIVERMINAKIAVLEADRSLQAFKDAPLRTQPAKSNIAEAPLAHRGSDTALRQSQSSTVDVVLTREFPALEETLTHSVEEHGVAPPEAQELPSTESNIAEEPQELRSSDVEAEQTDVVHEPPETFEGLTSKKERAKQAFHSAYTATSRVLTKDVVNDIVESVRTNNQTKIDGYKKYTLPQPAQLIEATEEFMRADASLRKFSSDSQTTATVTSETTLQLSKNRDATVLADSINYDEVQPEQSEEGSAYGPYNEGEVELPFKVELPSKEDLDLWREEGFDVETKPEPTTPPEKNWLQKD